MRIVKASLITPTIAMRVKQSLKFRMSIILTACISISTTCLAQPGIQNFSLTNVVDGKPISLDQYASSPVVVVFTSNECPFDNYYKGRIKEMISSYSGKVQFLLINSHPTPEESDEKMAIHLADLSAPYLADKDQTVMENFGAKKSPEVFVLKPAAGKFMMMYSGAIDDNPQVSTDVKQNYLKDAIDKVLSGQRIEVISNRAVGCSIRRK